MQDAVKRHFRHQLQCMKMTETGLEVVHINLAKKKFETTPIISMLSDLRTERQGILKVQG